MTYVNESPNFSIILPGGCNARCKFCFWRQRSGGDFLAGLARALRILPDNFRTVSITGGEPTLSRSFSATLAVIRTNGRSWERIVLTTNGAALLTQADAIAQVCTHVNVSRHGVTDRANRRVFGTESVPSREELRLVIARLSTHGVPTTLSRVLDSVRPETRDSIEKYVAFAKRMGAASVHLRKRNGDLAPHPVEAEFAHLHGWNSSCPACSNRVQFIGGMAVTWKRGLLETADAGRHEAILQSDGRLTWDWAGRVPFAPPRPSSAKRLAVMQDSPRMSADAWDYFRNGCGFGPQVGCGSSRGGC